MLTHLMHIFPFKLEHVPELSPKVARRGIVMNGRSNGSVILSSRRPILCIVWTIFATFDGRYLALYDIHMHAPVVLDTVAKQAVCMCCSL